MPEWEKVKNGLHQHCECSLFDRCGECPYYETDYESWGESKFKCRDELLRDALALLNEQERKKGSWDYGTQCSVCKGTIVPPWKRDTRVNFCPWCGADMRGGYDE